MSAELLHDPAAGRLRPDWYTVRLSSIPGETVRRLAVSIPGRGRATAGGDGWHIHNYLLELLELLKLLDVAGMV